jgi:hypothetical protein
MTATGKAVLCATLAVALIGTGCSAGSVKDSPTRSGDSGTGANDPGPSGPSTQPPGGTTDPNGSGSPGMGGGNSTGGSSASASGSGGAAGAAGGSAGAADGGIPSPPIGLSDAAASADGGSSPFLCAITLQPLMPTRFDGVPAGEGNRFRMGATVSGSQVPVKPTWHWQVTHDSGAAVAASSVDGEPAAIEFPTVKPGAYTVVVDLVGISGCAATATVNAVVVPVNRAAEFFLRVTPPAGMGLAMLETDLLVQSDQPIVRPLELESLPPVGHVDPHEGTDALPAYFVQISSPTSTARYEAYLDTRVARPPFFDAYLVRGNYYNVLIVPDLLAGVPVRAPIVFKNLSYDGFGATTFQVDGGVAIAGKVSLGDAPLAESRVRLRDDLLPSTVGRADATGAYSLQARPGRFEARVVPPASSGLPEAQLPRSAGIVIPDRGLDGALDFSYAPVAMTKLVLTVQKSDGAAPERPISVVLQSLQGQLGNVGKFTVAGQELPVDGVVRLAAETGSGGSLTIEKLPRAHYRVIMSPPDGLAGDSAITTIEDLDLTGAAAVVTRTAPLAKRGLIVGHLSPATRGAGLMVRVMDVGEDGVRRNTVIVPADATGRFSFASDPQRLYRLFVEPPADRRVPRLTLDPVRATAGTVEVTATLPARLSLSGTTTVNGRGPLGGAIVQVFCRGPAPACVDRSAADVSNTLPIDEAVTGADGRYDLGLPGGL